MSDVLYEHLPIGTRVVAIASARYKLTQIYGFGVHEDLFMPGDVTPLSDKHRLARGAIGSNQCPRIELDNGTYIWGSQCWWIEEGAYRRCKRAKREKVVPVPPLEAQVNGSHDEVRDGPHRPDHRR